MSMRAETYIIYGRKLDAQKAFNDETYDKLSPLKFSLSLKNVKGTSGILFDGMDGSYVIAGYCIDVGAEWDGPQMSFNEIDDHYLKLLDHQTTDWIIQNLPYTLCESEENKLYILTHYH